MDRGMKRIAVLGSTGSIGQQTLEVVRAFPEKLEVVALATRRNTTLMRQQIQEFHPELVLVGGQGPSLEELASHPDVDLVVVATSGKAGLLPTLAAIRSGKAVALANKEALVMAGGIVMAEARRYGVEIRPVDSEHSAIWQCLQGEESNQIAQIILTASGGPFRDRSPEELGGITAEQALQHPTWHMGRKVTIDSATLMNKGMEVIEAHWLFGLPYDRIKVMIHPGSIIHSMVEFVDGSVKAQLGVPDMRLPIQYALSHPERWANPVLPELNLEKIDSLELEPVDMERFPCLKLAVEAGTAGDTYPAVLCAADEMAVDFFLGGKIGFLDIPRLIRDTLDLHGRVANPALEDILAADDWARATAKEWIGQ
ncbi:1-deoxy-D-xylulose-5-phosphate reductoisomerase [Dehalococcoidia bacterium]|nr:1-deoxy-D-xylulose-5-phosphate reductoisomerase [Dehalococcoidia bacterium]